MRCDTACQTLSAVADGAAAGAEANAAAAHTATCPTCADFERDIAALRRAVRFELCDDAGPDVAPAVMAAVRSAPSRAARRPAWLAAAAAFVTMAIVGASLVGLDRPSPVVAADLGARVVAAQARLETLTARLTVIEAGWHPDVPRRRLTGSLAYRAPESLALSLTVRSTYPDRRWQPNDIRVVVAGGRWWRRGPVPCPRDLQPACATPTPRVQTVAHREPFDSADPAPLDLVLPVRSFTLAAPGQQLGARRVAGRPATGVTTTVAQVQPLLDGLHQAGDWRALHPADPVELWLDDDALVPLELVVRPAAGRDRRRWAASLGYRDPPGRAVLTLRLTDVAVNDGVAPDRFAVPRAPEARDAGFALRRAGGVAAPGLIRPTWLPPGFVAHRGGTTRSPGGPPVQVATWTDGRAWLKVRATRRWAGGRLFGDLGPVVRVARSPGAGVVHLDAAGTRVALHGTRIDVEVSGSLTEADLRRVAAGLGVVGRPVPDGWAEAAMTDLAGARARLPGLLLPSGLRGFGPPAARLDGDAVTLAYTGPGARAFLLTQSDAPLSPPLEPGVRGVAVRGRAGRYSPDRGELEWREGGRTVSLRSTTLPIDELLTIAERLRP